MQSEIQDSSKNDDVKFVRSKHTMRRAHRYYYYDDKNLNSTLSVAYNTKSSHGYSHHEVPVTEIDNYFPSSMLATSNMRVLYGTTRSINTPDRWNDLLEDLERLSISKSSEYDHEKQFVKFTYTVPVIGHVIIRNDNNDPMVTGFTGYNTNMKHPNWLYWNGSFFDPRYLYQVPSFDGRNQRFRKIGLKCPPNQEFNNKNIIEIPYRVVHQSRFRYRINSTIINRNMKQVSTHAASQGSGWLQTEQHPFLEIDLHTEVNITHIGTAGRYPVVFNFPSPDARKKIFGDEVSVAEYNQKVLYHNQSLRKSLSIQVVEPNIPISYVTQYKIQYYHHVSKKWIGLSDVFSGNSDALTEVVHALADHYNTPAGLYTRYLRITPIAYQYKPYMRVAIYGLNTAKIKKLSNITSQQDNEIEVVSYTVNPSVISSFDGKKKECISKSYHYDYMYGCNEMSYRYHRKKVYDAMINDGILMVDDHYNNEDTEDVILDVRVDDMSSYEHVSQRQPMHLSDFICSAGANAHVEDTAINQDIEYEEQLALARALSLSSEEHHNSSYDDASMFTANAVIDIDDCSSSTDSYIRCSDVSHDSSEDGYIYIESDDNTDI